VMDYISIPILAAFYCFWKLFKRTKFISLDDMDFVTGRSELDAISDEYDAIAAAQPPKSFWGRIWGATI